ncbi:MAG: DNA-protecting protein DprA [Ruminococcaceae bacterium]|nr:DNA-protecting protein DprA [Oscillospiraceae bacterium]
MTNNKDYVYYAWLSHRLGAGSSAFKRLINIFGDAKSIYECRDLSPYGLTEKQLSSLADLDLKNEERAINAALNTGFSIIHYNDEIYPKKLKLLSNPPAILYVKGIIPDFDKYFSVGIVGTRHPSAESLKMTQKISSDLSKKGVIVISGLAFGIDSEAHSAALKNGGFTVGISAVKAGQIYPKENEFLYSKMYQNGLVICEHSPVSQVEKSAFPTRNRIISALSDALIMMEAPEKSGALITAEKSLSLKKPVFVPYGDITKNSGGRKLLEKKALPLSSEYDILNYFSGLSDKHFMEIKDDKSEKIIDVIPEEKHFILTNEKASETSRVAEAYSVNDESNVPEELDDVEKKIYLYLKKNFSASTDQLSRDLALSSVEATSSASMMEIYGYIKRMPGDKWSIL